PDRPRRLSPGQRPLVPAQLDDGRRHVVRLRRDGLHPRRRRLRRGQQDGRGRVPRSQRAVVHPPVLERDDLLPPLLPSPLPGLRRPGYLPVAPTCDGAGMTDLAVYNPPTGLWYSRNSHDGSTTTVGFGGTGYTAVPGDYDGDGKADLAVFHAASGLWFIKYS